MTDIEARAAALTDEARFCEWLDATRALPSGWPHSRYAARQWLLQECEVDTLRSLRVDPEAAATYEQIEARFALWDQNGELPV
ncbi:hypothetical protein [Halomonas sp.]|uniref:hypothetical protein n=1 Tax=Halomonas sp. TaxID=1486246 RepID=UPI003D0A792E